MQCPKCGAFNPEGFSSCGICGLALRDSTTVESGDKAPELVQQADFSLRPESIPSLASAGPTESAPGWSFAAPAIETGSTQNASIEKVANGQKLIIYSILGNLAMFVLSALLGEIAGIFLPLVAIAAVALAILGVVQVSSGLGYSTGSRIVLIMVSFVPLIGLLMLVMVNARATRALKEAGYSVGLLGAR